MTVFITLTLAGSDSGPFDLYSDVDGFLYPFETDVPKVDLLSGYSSANVPDYTSIIRVKSKATLCTNQIDINVVTTTTTTEPTCISYTFIGNPTGMPLEYLDCFGVPQTQKVYDSPVNICAQNGSISFPGTIINNGAC